jgi:hypothetical protein
MDDAILDVLHELIDFAGSEPARARLHELVEDLRAKPADEPAKAEPEPEPDPAVSYTGA